MGGVDVGGPVVLDEGEHVRVQGQVAVLVQLADRHVQPGSGADVHESVGGQGGVLADSQAGAQQHFHGDAQQHPGLGLGGAQQPRGARVVQRLGQGPVLAGQVTGEHRHPGRGVVPATLADPDEEHPQRAQPAGDGGQAQRGPAAAGAGGQPRLVSLDGGPVDVGHAGQGRGVGEQVGGEAAQRLVGAVEAARARHAGQLGQVCPHGGRDLRQLGGDLVPGRDRRGAAASILGGVEPDRQGGAHRSLRNPGSAGRSPAPGGGVACTPGTPAKTWASMTSAALRYWEASQSSARCR